MCDIHKPLPIRAKLRKCPLATLRPRPGYPNLPASQTGSTPLSPSILVKPESQPNPTKLLQGRIALDNDRELLELAAVEQDLFGVPQAVDCSSNPFQGRALPEEDVHRVPLPSRAPERRSCPPFRAPALAPERPTNPILQDPQWLRMQDESTESGDDSSIEPMHLAFATDGLNSQWESHDYSHSYEETTAKL